MFNSIFLIFIKYLLLLIWKIYLKVVDYLIDPFVGGTSAADPESLSVSCFSKFWIFQIKLDVTIFKYEFLSK
jgi:hypothetical protein